MSADPIPTADAVAQTPALLFVDDEANILSALRRLFRPHGYRIFIAEGGQAGLEVLEKESIDLVISDMRMPEMDGARFLEQVRLRWPDVTRILLTGYADVASTIDAINKGEIYRYVAKPWDDNEIVLMVRQALESRDLKRENARLGSLLQKQNEELKALNNSLEAKVAERTGEVRQTMSFLELAHDRLKKQFMTFVMVFSNLMEMRSERMAGHSRRVADLARRLAVRMGMEDGQVQDVIMAGLLHDVGKMALPDHLLAKPYGNLSQEELLEVVKHPARGKLALMGLEQLRGAAALIQSHHEHFDGGGFPDRLSGFAIPLGARILAVANEYDGLVNGLLLPRRFNENEAVAYIREGSGSRYDPAVVEAFLAETKPGTPKEEERELTSGQLRSGMTLARDLFNRDGFLLLAKGHVLNDGMIEQVRSYERVEKLRLAFWIRS